MLLCMHAQGQPHTRVHVRARTSAPCRQDKQTHDGYIPGRRCTSKVPPACVKSYTPSRFSAATILPCVPCVPLVPRVSGVSAPKIFDADSKNGTGFLQPILYSLVIFTMYRILYYFWQWKLINYWTILQRPEEQSACRARAVGVGVRAAAARAGCGVRAAWAGVEGGSSRSLARSLARSLSLSLSLSQDCQEWYTSPTFITGQSR